MVKLCCLAHILFFIASFLVTSYLLLHFSTGGNYLLNVGPSHDGRIMPIFEEILLEIGMPLM